MFDCFFSLYNSIGEKNKSSDFFILHLVTAFWSIGHIANFLDTDGRFNLIVTFIKVAGATYTIQGCPDFDLNYNCYDNLKKLISHIIMLGCWTATVHVALHHSV